VVRVERLLPRTLAAIAVFASVVLALAGVGYLVIPPLVDQTRDLASTAPDLLDQLSKGRGPFGFLERDFSIVERTRGLVDARQSAGIGGLDGRVLGIAGRVLTLIIGTSSVAFLTLFMLISGPELKRSAFRWLGPRHGDLVERLVQQVHRSVGGWVIGALALSATAGISTSILLAILGVPYPLALGLLVALGDPIPFIGITIAAGAAALVALATQGPTTALVFVLSVVIYQIVVENHVLVPLVYGQTVRLSALGVLASVLIGGELAGIVGAVLAVPVAGALKVSATEVIAWRRENHSSPSAADTP
jgi:predicted PurR-regulated permease PerM